MHSAKVTLGSFSTMLLYAQLCSTCAVRHKPVALHQAMPHCCNCGTVGCCRAVGTALLPGTSMLRLVAAWLPTYDTAPDNTVCNCKSEGLCSTLLTASNCSNLQHEKRTRKSFRVALVTNQLLLNGQHASPHASATYVQQPSSRIRAACTGCIVHTAGTKQLPRKCKPAYVQTVQQVFEAVGVTGRPAGSLPQKTTSC